MNSRQEEDDMTPMPSEVQAEMERRIKDAQMGNTMSMDELRRQLAKVVEERPDMFPQTSVSEPNKNTFSQGD